MLIQPDQWGQPLLVDDDTEEDRKVALRMQGQESFLTSFTEEYAACFHTFINALRDKTFEMCIRDRMKSLPVCGFMWLIRNDDASVSPGCRMLLKKIR